MPKIIISEEHRWWMNNSKIMAICKYLREQYGIAYHVSKTKTNDVVIKFNASSDQMNAIRKQLSDATLRLICKIED